jgi:DNA-binding LacI/PurR family transcriptional regulator
VHMQLLICPASSREQQKAYFEMFSNSRFEGILLTHRNMLDSLALEMLVRNGRPYMLLDQALLDEGLKTARDWFIEWGHQCVGLIAGPASLLEPASAYQAGKKLSHAIFHYIEIPANPDTWHAHIPPSEGAPTAFLCTDDQTALQLRDTLTQAGINAPVMGIGNSALARWARLPSLAFNGKTLGRNATLGLLKMLNVPTPLSKEELFFAVATNALPIP